MLFDIRHIKYNDMKPLIERFHSYKSLGKSQTYCFGYYEENKLVACFSWQPPAFGAAKAVCKEFPAGVLALSRMVALPKTERKLKHISKPLKHQMKQLIDRGRWPVLITYSDESVGHNGFTYQCSGWEKTTRVKRKYYVDCEGRRTSTYSNGESGIKKLTLGGETFLQRWEHWICEKGQADVFSASKGFVKRPVEGKRWISGNQAYTYVKEL